MNTLLGDDTKRFSENPIRSFCQFDQLEEVWLGDCWPCEFYSDYDPEIKSAFEKITEITKDDLDNIESVLKSLGITVRRPQFSKDSSLYKNSEEVLYKPPIAPRDDNIVFGTTLHQLRQTYKHNPWIDVVDQYRDLGGRVIEHKTEDLFGNLVCSSVVRLGEDVFIDICSHRHDWDFFINHVVPEITKEFRVNLCSTSGHSDSVFCPIGPGLILTSHWKDDYSKEYPGWKVHRIPKNTGRPTVGKIHVPSLEKSWFMQGLEGPCYAFNEHIAKYALDWVGLATETVFEVNSLVVNPNLIITTGYPDTTTKAWFKQNKIEYIPCQMRARHFWDAGVHCLTVDIKRKGNKRDLFGTKDQKVYWYTD
jgi:hypothetical protein